MNIERRIEKAEEQMGTGREPVVHEIVHFGGGPLQPEEKRGSVIVRHLSYERVSGDVWKGAAADEP